MQKQHIKLGIDVGGTFTHAVAVDSCSLEVISEAKVLTTHNSSLGVAEGIVSVLEKIMSHPTIDIKDINFIAHSTTQATNALLEGDLAPVGLVAIGRGLESRIIKHQTHITAFYEYIDSKNINEDSINMILDNLEKNKIKAIVAAEAYAIDDPANEKKVLELIRKRNIPAIGSHEISGLYGLKIRTRTALLNASILPKMTEVSDYIEQAMKKVGLNLPLMVMRSDGGVISLNEVKKRPLLTILSGPAAGIAGALFYEKISDGIFIEVGGTSTDVSVIQNGRANLKTADVGGHKLFLKTLDVKTIGSAGGSLVSIKKNKIVRVGPRSAHIMGMKYVSYADPEVLQDAKIKLYSKDNYLCLEGSDGCLYAVTPTCAANFLGNIKPTDYAYGCDQSVRIAFIKIQEYFRIEQKDFAKKILDLAMAGLRKIVKEFIETYKLDVNQIMLIGGGGGAAAIVPPLALDMKIDYKLVKKQSVISALGVALALIQETIEKNILSPTPEQILNVKEEAEQKVITMGALPQTVESLLEFDRQKNLVRATATGSFEMSTKEVDRNLTQEERISSAARSMLVPEEKVEVLSRGTFFNVYGANISESRLWGLIKNNYFAMRVLSKEGVNRLKISNGSI
ncbi:MAG: hydantoinase/oxoprolinase family protein, partial [bacterium]